jgi:hypothetical protein
MLLPAPDAFFGVQRLRDPELKHLGVTWRFCSDPCSSSKFHPGQNSIMNHEIPLCGEWAGLRFLRKNQVIASLTLHR